MPYELSAILSVLDRANAALARVSSLHAQLDAIADYLHDGSPEQAAAFKAKTLKKADLEKAVAFYNGRLRKTSASPFSLNTFAINDGVLVIGDEEEGDKDLFDGKINDFVASMTAARAYFKAGTPLFGADGAFDRSSSVMMTLSYLESHKKALETFIRGVKRKYNQTHPGDQRYLVALNTACQKDQTISEWVTMLRDKGSISQRYHELLTHYKQKHYHLKKEEAKKRAEIDVFCEVATAYMRDRDRAYFDRVFAGNAEIHDQAINLSAIAGRRRLDVMESPAVMALIQAELEAHRSVHVSIRLKHKKDKFRSLFIGQWTTLFALLTTVGEACVSAYFMAQALGYTATSGSLFAYLSANPAAMAGTVAIFVSVLVINTLLFDSLLRKLLSMFVKNRVLRNKDGSSKTPAEKGMLIGSLLISTLTAVGAAALSFSGCQAAFSAILQAGSTSPAVLAISAVIAAVSFVAIVSFNYQFFMAVLSNWKGYKKQMDRLFLKGRCKAGKGALLGLCSVLAVLYTVGSVMVNFTSLSKVLSGISIGKMASNGLSGALTAISGFFFAFAGFSANRSMLALMRKKCADFKNFCKTNNGAAVAGKLAAIVLKSLASVLLFFPAAIVLVTLRMALAAVKLSLNLIGLALTPILGVATGLVFKASGKTFKGGMRSYATVVQSVVKAWDGAWSWWRKAFMFCAARGGLFAGLLNASAQAALRKVDMTGMSDALTGPTMVDSAALSFLPNNGAMEEAVNGDGTEDIVTAHLDRERAAERTKGTVAALEDEASEPRVAAKKLSFWGSFGESMARQFPSPRQAKQPVGLGYIDQAIRAVEHSRTAAV